MTKRTITKFFSFVIYLCVSVVIFSACGFGPAGNTSVPKASHYFPPRSTGSIADAEITESSGLIASKCQPDILWTHNDSGDGSYVYAINKSGAKLGTWQVPDAENLDWEDIAGFKDSSGKCFVYIGEIGDNKIKRSDHVIYRIREPRAAPDDAKTTKAQPSQTEAAEVLRFKYPDGNHDAETLLVHPKSGDIYVLTKRTSGPSGVYRLRGVFGKDNVNVAEKIADVSMPAIPNGFVTGGDVSPDGRRVIISDYSAGYEFTLPDGSANFDDIWKQEPETVDLGKRRVGESVCYSPDGNAIYASSEGKGSPIYEIRRRP